MIEGELLAYLAGFFDGEGCVTIAKERRAEYKCGFSYRLVVLVSQSQEHPLDLYKSTFGGSIRKDLSSFRKHGRSIIYRWTARSTAGLSFLEAALPYLRLKKEQAELAIEFQKSRKHHREDESTDEEDYVEMRRLKQSFKEYDD